MMMTMMLGELHLKKMEDEEEAISTPSLKVRIRRKHSKRSATETLLDYIEKGKKKKEISFDLVTGAKKKQRNRKRVNRVNSEEAILVEKKLVRSLMDYRKTFSGRASVQMKVLVMFRSVTRVVHDDNEGDGGALSLTLTNEE